MQNELVFRPARELAELVRSKEVSPVEITDAFLARIEELNPKLNAFITVTADEARRVRTRGRTGDRVRQLPGSAPRNSVRAERHPRDPRHPHHERLAGDAGLGSGLRVDDYRKASRGRRGPPRKSEPPRVRDGKRCPFGLRSEPQSVASRLQSFRILERLGDGARRLPHSALDWNGYRRIDSRSGRRLRDRRVEADLRPREPLRCHHSLLDSRPRRPDDENRFRRRDHAPDHRRSRSERPDDLFRARSRLRRRARGGSRRASHRSSLELLSSKGRTKKSTERCARPFTFWERSARASSKSTFLTRSSRARRDGSWPWPKRPPSTRNGFARLRSSSIPWCANDWRWRSSTRPRTTSRPSGCEPSCRTRWRGSSRAAT